MKIKAKVINYENTSSPDELKRYGIGGADLKLNKKDREKIKEETLKGGIEANVSEDPKNKKITGIEVPISYEDIGRALYVPPKDINPNRETYAPKEPEQTNRNFIQKVFDKLTNNTEKQKQQRELEYRDSIQKGKEAIKDMAHNFPGENFDINKRQPMPPIGEWPKPVDKMVVTSPYGLRIHPKKKKPIPHDGIDIGVPMNTPVHASFDGKVTTIEDLGKKGYGKYIIIDHGKDENGKNVQTYHAHLNNFKVKQGDIVKAGQEIGRSGSTGASTGPHLHYEIRFVDNKKKKNKDDKGDVNPLKYLKK